MTFAEIILVGNVGRDPELKFTQSGTAVCDFSLAVNRRWTERSSNERREETTWFKITVWGSQAETVNQYVQKGRQVMVVGDRIQASAYMGNDGEPRASLEVTARNVTFLSGGGSEGGGYNRDSGGYDEAPADVDDIPF
jgi:single-strand DNA-binding protein